MSTLNERQEMPLNSTTVPESLETHFTLRSVRRVREIWHRADLFRVGGSAASASLLSYSLLAYTFTFALPSRQIHTYCGS